MMNPEEEQDTSSTEQCIHDVDHLGNLACIVGKERKEIADEHEEWCTRWVTNFQFGCCGDKFRAIPEACRGFYGRAVGECSNGEHYPTDYVVDNMIFFHVRVLSFKAFEFSSL